MEIVLWLKKHKACFQELHDLVCGICCVISLLAFPHDSSSYSYFQEFLDSLCGLSWIYVLLSCWILNTFLVLFVNHVCLHGLLLVCLKKLHTIFNTIQNITKKII